MTTMDKCTAVDILADAAKKWGDMLDGLRERGQLVQIERDNLDGYRKRISEATETLREATRCSQR